MPICTGLAFRLLLWRDCYGVANLEESCFQIAMMERLFGGCQFAGFVFEIALRRLRRDSIWGCPFACFSDVANLLRAAFKTVVAVDIAVAVANCCRLCPSILLP